jgi:hypothetical protein
MESATADWDARLPEVEGVRTAIENAGARLLWLPSQPDRAMVRQAESPAAQGPRRELSTPSSRHRPSARNFPPDERENYLANSGYPGQE